MKFKRLSITIFLLCISVFMKDDSYAKQGLNVKLEPLYMKMFYENSHIGEEIHSENDTTTENYVSEESNKSIDIDIEDFAIKGEITYENKNYNVGLRSWIYKTDTSKNGTITTDSNQESCGPGG